MPEHTVTEKLISLFLTIIVINFFAFIGPAGGHSGARFYRGEIKISTEWEGIIRITGKVTVAKNVIVTVAPGTKVLINSGEDVDIIVEGKLFVRGLPDMKVVFEPADGCSETTFWGGIFFQEGSGGEVEDALIRCSKKAIWGDLMGVTIRRVTVEDGER